MPFKHFLVPVSHGESAEQELNSFLSRHLVVVVEQHWHEQGESAMWCYRIEYVASLASDGSRMKRIGGLTSQHFANRYLGWFDRFAKPD